MKESIYGAIAVAVIVIVGAVVWYRLQPTTAETEPRVAQSLPMPTETQTGEVKRPEPTPELSPPPVVAPTTLDGSDTAVKSALANLAPQLLQWLTPPEQLRRWVIFVDQIADGSIPNDQRPLVYAAKPFQSARSNDALTIDQANFDRATPLIDTIVAIPPEKMAQYYRNWQPLFEHAYRELGRGGNFDARLRKALNRVAAVRLPPENAELNQAGVYFVFTNPNFEKATELEKLLWRIGPDNTRRLQAYLIQLQQRL